MKSVKAIKIDLECTFLPAVPASEGVRMGKPANLDRFSAIGRKV
jgi:hypothetical protein